MKIANEGFQHNEASQPKNNPTISGTIADGVGKSHRPSRPLLVLTGVALGLGLASCVAPYDSYGGSSGSVTVTSYSPGYSISSLPRGYRRETIAGTTYYYHDGHYYRPGSSGYVVVEAPRTSRYYGEYTLRQQRHQPGRGYSSGQVVTRLPRGYREINHGGTVYYQAGGRYYRRQGGGYVVVTRPY